MEKILVNWTDDTRDACATRNLRKDKVVKQPQVASNNTLITAAKPKGRAGLLLSKRNHSAQHAKTQKGPLTIYEIIPALEVIAQSEDITTIPIEVAQSLLQVLDLRTRCLAWFKSNTSQDDTETRESNRRHEHVVKILREAVELLQHKMPTNLHNKTTKIPRVVSTSEEKVREVSNLFDSLAVAYDGPSNNVAEDYLEPTGDSPQPSDDSTSGLKLSADEVAQEEYNFARFCFWQDVEAIEEYILLIIARYSLRPDDDHIVSLLMNVAVDLVERMDDELCKTFTHPAKREIDFMNSGGFANPTEVWMVPQLRMRVLLSSRLKEANDYVFGPDVIARASPFASEIQDQVNYDMLFLKQIIAQARKQDLQVYKGVLLDPATNKLGQWVAYSEKNPRYHILEMRPSTSFAVRLNMLMSYMLAEDKHEVLDRLQDKSQSINKSTSSRLEYWESSGHALSRAPELREQITDACRQALERTTNISTGCENNRDLLSILPHLSSLTKSHLAYEHSAVASQAVEVGNVATSMAHVYNAVREEGLLASKWADVEFLLEHGGTEAMFQGLRPTTELRGRFAPRLLHASGIREASFGTTHEGNKQDFFEKRKLGIILGSRPITESLYNRALESFDKPENHVLGSTDTELIVFATAIPKLLDRPAKKVQLEGIHIVNRTDLWKLKDDGPDLTPTELLVMIKYGLEEENKIYQFDHFEFEKACTGLMQELVAAWQEQGFEAHARVLSLETKLDSGGKATTEATLLDAIRQMAYQILEYGKNYHSSTSKELYIRGLQAAADVFEKCWPSTGLWASKAQTHRNRPSTYRRFDLRFF